VKWWRDLIANFGATFGRAASVPRDPDLRRTAAHHRKTITDADRVIKAYVALDGVLELRVKRAHQR